MNSPQNELEKIRQAAQVEQAKGAGWIKANRLPLGIGFAACAALWAFVHFVL